MQKVDLVIAGVGVVAVVATVLGVVFYEEAAGEQTVVFPESSVSREDSATGSGTLILEFDLPANATAVRGLSVVVDFTGTAGVQPTGGSYEVRVDAPGNGTCDGATATWSPNEQTVTVPDCRWLPAPESRTTADVSGVNETVTWSQPLRIELVITNPSATNVPNVHSYSYSATAQGEILAYQALVQTPDPQAAR